MTFIEIGGNGSLEITKEGQETTEVLIGIGNPQSSSGSSVTVLDEDDMVSNSAVAVPSQQSVKAYVDTEVASVTTGGVTVLDEDNMASNSPTAVPSQQSVKAYVDAEAGAAQADATQALADAAAAQTTANSAQADADVRAEQQVVFITNDAPNRRWFRVATIDGINTNSGASFHAFLGPTGNFGNQNRGTILISFTQRGSNSTQVRAWGFGADDVQEAFELHTVQISEFVFELWCRASSFTRAQSITVLGGYSFTINMDSVTSTAPVSSTQWAVNEVSAFPLIDEDDMVSNSDTAVPTQQSVKAYVDTEVAAAGGSPPYASTTVSGVIQLATQAQVDAETSDDRAVTPATLANYVNAEVGPVQSDATQALSDASTAQATANQAIADAAAAQASIPNSLNDIDGATVTASVNVNGQRIINVGTPTVATNAATKQYVDDEIAGVSGGSANGEPTRSDTTHSATGPLAITTAAARFHSVTTVDGADITGYNLTYPASGNVDIVIQILAPPTGSVDVDLTVTGNPAVVQTGTFVGTLTAGDQPFVIELLRFG